MIGVNKNFSKTQVYTWYDSFYDNNAVQDRIQSHCHGSSDLSRIRVCFDVIEYDVYENSNSCAQSDTLYLSPSDAASMGSILNNFANYLYHILTNGKARQFIQQGVPRGVCPASIVMG